MKTADVTTSLGSGEVPRDIIVVGASAGEVDAYRVLAAGLSRDFRASTFVVLLRIAGLAGDTRHNSYHGRASSRGSGERSSANSARAYLCRAVGPSSYEPGIVRTTRGPRENQFRPAVDPLFRSAAQYTDRGLLAFY